MFSCCRCQFKSNWVKSDLITACDFQGCPSHLSLLLVSSCSRNQELDPLVLVLNKQKELCLPPKQGVVAAGTASSTAFVPVQIAG